MNGQYVQPIFSAITEDSLQSQILGVFFQTHERFQRSENYSDRFTTFFEDSQIFRETPAPYKFFLYFNLPYEWIVKNQVEPTLVFEVSNDNDEIKTNTIASLIGEFADDDPAIHNSAKEHKRLKRSRSPSPNLLKSPMTSPRTIETETEEHKDQDKTRRPNIILMKVDMTE